MKRRTIFFACALLLAVVARAQWNGYEVKTISTTPATTLNSGYYALFQNGHKGFAFLSESMLNLWGNNYNLAKNRINSSTPGISAFSDLNQNIATGPAPNDRRWYVFKITNNGNGTCTIQCADGTYIPAFGNRVKLVSSTTPGVFEFYNHGNYFSFKNNGQGLNGDDYGAGYAHVSTLASWDYSTPNANGNAAWTLYPVEMQPVLDTTKRYLLKHVNSGHYLYLHDNYTETKDVNATSLRPVGTAFTIAKSGTGYTFTKVGTTKTLGCANGSWSGWNTSNSVATAWQFSDAGNGNYYITSSKGYLGPNNGVTDVGGHIYTDKTQRNDMIWQLVEADAAPVIPADGKIYALYNAYTNGDYPVTSAPGIATDQNATPQLYVFRANGTDGKGTTLFRLQKADFDGKYLTWTNNSPWSVTHSTGTSNFLFLNNASSGYTWQTGTAPVAPLYNFVGYAGNQYTIFGDKKSTTNTGFDGYSRRSATTLLNNAQCARGANYSTTWKLVEQPYELYNLVITGNDPSTNPTVTYNNAWDNAIQRTPQTNGGGFLVGYDARSLSPAHFTAQELEGHILASVAIKGKTITVTYKTNVDVTYIYKYGDTEWFRETQTVPAGFYPDLKTPPTGVKYTTIPFGNLQDDATFVVNCEITPGYRVVPSENFENANWVYLSIVDNYGNAKFLRYDANTPNKIHSTADQPTADPSFKWAFVGSPFTGYKIYNQATGSTKIMTSTNPNGDGNTGGNTFIHMETETADMEANGFNTYWTITNNSLGILLSRKGQSIYANNRNGTFAFWTGGNDAGSRMFVVPIANKQPATSLVDSKGENVVSNKQYRLINRNSGIALTGNAGGYLGRSGRNNNDNQLWTLTADGNGFQIKNATKAYLTGGPTSQSWASTADASSHFAPNVSR